MRLITESDRKKLHSLLWPSFKSLPIPRPYRTALCQTAISHIVEQLQTENPAFQSLADALNLPNPFNTTT